MKNLWRELDDFLGRFLSPAVRWLLVANVLLFLLYALLSPFAAFRGVFRALMQTPDEAVYGLRLWQFVTYMFMHASPFHLLVNLLVLWFFGPRLEYRWGRNAFLRFYFAVGVGAGLVHAALALTTGHGADTMLGSSGAMYGIMLAYALYWPDDLVLLYFVIPVKIKYLMVFIGVFTFLGSISGGGNISHITHLGGLLTAFAYLKGGGLFRPGAGGPRFQKVDPRRHPDFR